MSNGFFVVSQYEDDPKDIHFQTLTESGPPPEDQLQLKTEIERTLVVLKMLFETDEERYFTYFYPLLSLAQCGLVGDHAQPEVARRALHELRSEVTDKEAGNVKNRYLKNLGAHSICLSALPLLLGLFFYFLNGPHISTNLLFLWVGSMVGVWVSFGARKTVFKFEDLNIPEKDRLDPFIRLSFAGVLSLIMGILFYKQALVVTVGNLNTAAIAEDPLIATIIGVFCGISELVLPSKIRKQAEQFILKE